MNEHKRLLIEILSGPLDGMIVAIDGDVEWTKSPDSSPLAFPWDNELGEPQAKFAVEEDQWWIEPIKSSHGTYIINRQIKLRDKILIQTGDILKASRTWIIIKKIA